MKPSSAVLVCLFILSSVCPAVGRQMTLALQWTPQAQFAGFYVAQEKGFYEEAGLDLKIFSGSADNTSSSRLADGTVDFATMFLGTALERYERGEPVVNIAQLIQHSSLLIVTRKDSGIERIEDLDGGRIASWGAEFQVQARGLFEQKGIHTSIVPSNDPVELFLRGATEGTLAMWYNEYHTLLNFGLREDELTYFFFNVTSFDFPEDGIYCLSSTCEQYREEARALVEATFRGWHYAFEHPEEALDIVIAKMEEEHIPATRVHQRWMLEKMRVLLLADIGDEDSYGRLSEEQFANTVNALKNAGIIESTIAYDRFYKDVIHVQ